VKFIMFRRALPLVLFLLFVMPFSAFAAENSIDVQIEQLREQIQTLTQTVQSQKEEIHKLGFTATPYHDQELTPVTITVYQYVETKKCPCANVKVFLIDTVGKTYTDVSDSNGVARFNVPVGTYIYTYQLLNEDGTIRPHGTFWSFYGYQWYGGDIHINSEIRLDNYNFEMIIDEVMW
jgi:hypothetical protein